MTLGRGLAIAAAGAVAALFAGVTLQLWAQRGMAILFDLVPVGCF